MLGSRGQIIPAPLSALEGSPFESYFVPGVILFCALGLVPLAAALLAWFRHPLAPTAALGVGITLLIWMAVEIAIVGYGNNPPLQPFYVLLGAVITGVGLGVVFGNSYTRRTGFETAKRCAMHQLNKAFRTARSLPVVPRETVCARFNSKSSTCCDVTFARGVCGPRCSSQGVSDGST